MGEIMLQFVDFMWGFDWSTIIAQTTKSSYKATLGPNSQIP